MKYCIAAACGILFLFSCSTSRELPVETIEKVVIDTVFVTAPSAETQAAAPAERPVFNAEAEREFELVHTRLDLSFDWANQWVLGKARLDLTPKLYADSILTLDAKNFELHRIASAPDGRALEYEYDGMQIVVDLDRTYTSSDTFGLYIDYTARPAEGEVGGSAAITSEQGLFFINHDGEELHKPMQIWTQGETENNSRWFPTIDKPNQRTSQEVILTVDDRFTTLSNGHLISSEPAGDGKRRDHWQLYKTHAPYLFFIAVGEYAVVEDSWKDCPVNYYVEPEYEKHAAEIFGHTPEMMSFFSELLNYSYPWNKYSQVVVRDYVSGAMENTTAVVYGEFVQREKGDLIDNNNDQIVAHELMHHWFGDLATCESWANLTMNEGFANYAEYLWIEHKDGKQSADLMRMNELQGYLRQAERNAHPLIWYAYEDKEDMFDAHSYNKGGLVLHMLRNWIGDEAFFASLNHFLIENSYEAVEADEFRLAIEEVTGMDLNWFFNDWYYGTGHPVVETSHDWDESSGKLELKLEQIQDAQEFVPVFRMPYVVEFFFSSGKSERKEIVMDRRVQEFTFTLPEKPAWVNVDADKVTMTVFNNAERADPGFVFEHATNLTDRLDGFQGLLQGGMQDSSSLDALLTEDFWLFRYITLNFLSNFGNTRHHKRIKELAATDPEPAVRAIAYDFLRNNIQYASEEMVTGSIRSDSSYSVLMNALAVLFKLNPDSAMNMAREYEGSLSATVHASLAELYAEYAKPAEKLDYFEQNWVNASGFRSPSYFEFWNSLAIKGSAEEFTGAIDKWAGIAGNENLSSFYRLGGLSALKGGLSELEDKANKSEMDFEHIGLLKEKINTIVKNIEDPAFERLIDRWESRRNR